MDAPPQEEIRDGTAEAGPVCAPVTADTWRQSAASDDRERGADLHVAMASDITRHAGLGLQNRALQVRFVSHLPLSLEFMGVLPRAISSICVR
jgi:hypothetical protein